MRSSQNGCIVLQNQKITLTLLFQSVCCLAEYNIIYTLQHFNYDDSFNNIQTASYINNENTDNIIAPLSTENSQKDYTSPQISISMSSVNKKKLFILGDSMVKHLQVWDISSKLHNNHKVYVRSFSSAKVKSMKDYSKPCIKE